MGRVLCNVSSSYVCKHIKRRHFNMSSLLTYVVLEPPAALFSIQKTDVQALAAATSHGNLLETMRIFSIRPRFLMPKESVLFIRH